MERVTFLVEQTNQRITCLLNPENLVVQRAAGIRSRRSLTGELAGMGLTDHPLLYTGGGKTELELDLLFDTTLVETRSVRDVRDLTSPLWNLAENTRQEAPPIIRFVWGKAWNIPGVITHIAEHLEFFTTQGVPQRSWIRLKLLRVNPPKIIEQENERITSKLTSLQNKLASMTEELGGSISSSMEALTSYEFQAGDRLDNIAQKFLGHARHWRLLAIFNNLPNPHEIAIGTQIVIPKVLHLEINLWTE